MEYVAINILVLFNTDFEFRTTLKGFNPLQMLTTVCILLNSSTVTIKQSVLM